MNQETLVTCPRCKQTGFTVPGLKSHYCRVGPQGEDLGDTDTRRQFGRLTATEIASVLPSPVPAVRSVKSVSLLDGSDQATAKELQKLFTDAQTGMRRIIALGLFAWEVKETKLKHGQWGPWLAQHCPSLCRAHPTTGKPQVSHALHTYMSLTAGVLDKLGYTVEKYLAKHVSNLPKGEICHGGKYLLLPAAKAKKLDAPVAELREKICALVDGKTQSQLFFEFKQAEEDANGGLKPKVGRLRGQGGASREQRVLAAEQRAAAELALLESTAETTTAWLLEIADDKHFGLIHDQPIGLNLLNAAQTLIDYARNLRNRAL